MLKVYFELKPYPTLRHTPKPVLQAIFKNPNDENKIFSSICLIDSGADYCSLPLESQISLGLNLEELGCEKRKMECACGNKKFSGYKYKLKVITFDTNKNPIERLLWVAFVGSNTMPLIGRNYMDIFEKIVYDNKDKRGYFEGLIENED